MRFTNDGVLLFRGLHCEHRLAEDDRRARSVEARIRSDALLNVIAGAHDPPRRADSRLIPLDADVGRRRAVEHDARGRAKPRGELDDVVTGTNGQFIQQALRQLEAPRPKHSLSHTSKEPVAGHSA